ncbi:MAG: hypothetical protein C4574_03885 [Candidatus Latescibacterota bacterium]|jgi:hypothetical protein|nr:MAG: hypothetical protein C4574_03885 [Candidatus Latescibacterota bacterium]
MKKEETKKIREFAFAVSTVLAILSRVRLWRGHDPHFGILLGAAGALALAAIFVPRVLRPVYRGWMVVARGLLWFNTRLLLSIIFFLVVTPIALAFRVARRDPLERALDEGAASYWKKRPQPPPARIRLRRQF